MGFFLKLTFNNDFGGASALSGRLIFKNEFRTSGHFSNINTRSATEPRVKNGLFTGG